jgi:Zn-dependent protease with chaperone function
MAAPQNGGAPPGGDESTPARHLSPFAFPSDTDSRFALLVGSVLAATLTTASLFHLTLWGRQYLAGMQSCFDAAQSANPEGASIDPSNTYVAIVAECSAPYQLSVALTMLGAVALVLTGSCLALWAYPIWQTRRERLQPLTDEDVPDVVPFLSSLRKEAGLARAPSFLWDPMDARTAAYAYGSFGRHYVALTGGLLTLFFADRASFRAIIMHELAHLRNADTGKTTFARVIPWVFAAVVMIPFVLSQATFDTTSLAENLRWRLELTARIAALFALLHFSRNAFLRAREFYADARAARRGEDRAVLSRQLAALTRSPGRSESPEPPEQAAQWRWRAMSRWRALLRFHPTPAERVRALAEPRRLFRAGVPEAVLTGITMGLGMPSALTLMTYVWNSVRRFVPFLISGEGAALGAALPFALLAAGVVGIGHWRQAFVARLLGRPAPGAARLALAVQGGFLLGLYLAPDLAAQADRGPFATAPVVLFPVAWNAALFVGLWLYLRWIGSIATGWTEAAAAGRTGVATFWLSMAVAGLVLAVLFAELLLIRFMSTGGPESERQDLLVGVLGMRLYSALTAPGFLIVLVMLWAVPLLTWWLRWPRGSGPALAWAFSEPVALSPAGRGDHRRSAVVASIAASLCGLLGGALVLWTIGFWRGNPAAGQLGLLVPLTIYAGGASASALAAVFTGLAAPRYRAVYALCAAFFAAVVTVATTALYRIAVGLALSGDALSMLFVSVANGAVLLACPLLLAIAVLRAAAGIGRRSVGDPLLRQAPVPTSHRAPEPTPAPVSGPADAAA